MGERDFAVRCVSLDRCAALYAAGLHVLVWRVEGHNQLAAMLEVPQTFYNRTVGLMGLWSTNRSDDFLMSDGRLLSSVDHNPPSEDKLHLFGLSCQWIAHYWIVLRAKYFVIYSFVIQVQLVERMLHGYISYFKPHIRITVQTVSIGAVPQPESLLFSSPPLDPFEPVSLNKLLEDYSPDVVEDLRRTCQGSMRCVHDSLASNTSNLGLQTLNAEKQYKNLAQTYGKTSSYYLTRELYLWLYFMCCVCLIL